MGNARDCAIQFFRMTLIAVILIIVLSSIGTIVFSKVRTYHGDGRPLDVGKYVESTFIGPEQDLIQINMTNLDRGRLTVSLRTPDRVLSNFSAVYLELIDLADHSQIDNRTVFSHFLFNIDELWIPHHGDYRLVVVKNDMEDDPVTVEVIYMNNPAIFLSDMGIWSSFIFLFCAVVLLSTFLIGVGKDTAIKRNVKERKWIGWTFSSVSIVLGIASATFVLLYPFFLWIISSVPLFWVMVPFSIAIGTAIVFVVILSILAGLMGIVKMRGRPLAVIGLILTLLTPSLAFCFFVFINLAIIVSEALS